ncbi:MAG: SDR family NAD(P)-dependent oxidoreductase [Azospirillaceae bacterium]|nr:SDR family NAD(P)-dependent oxidoreductase [Azospirillaceae bacterium]
MPNAVLTEAGGEKAYIVTGPTSGIGQATALELARHGTIVLVGRDAARLDGVRAAITQRGGRAVAVRCDLSDMVSVRRAAAEIIALRLPITGLVNNAGIMEMRARKSAQGWDNSFATNHLGPFALTEALLPHLPDGATVVFVASAAEDPERGPAKATGLRGGRYISAAASARGEWEPGGSTVPGGDAYTTSKQCVLAAAMELARENPRLYVNAIEPGINPGTGLARQANVVVRLLLKYVVAPIMSRNKYGSTPARAARVITRLMLNDACRTGVYYDQGGHPMLASERVRDTAFTSRVVAETRALLATVSG